MKKKRKPIVLIIILLLAVALATAGFFAYKPYLDDKNGKNQPDKAVSLEINNDNKYDIPYCLANKGIIKSVKMFKNYMDKTYGSSFQYENGIYKINSNMSYKELGEALQEPDTVIAKVAIPEGKNAYEISKILQDEGLCSSKEFISALGDDYSYDFLSSIDNENARPYKLEGYLFPATYEIEEGTSAHDIVDMMLKAMSLRINDSFTAKCKAMNISTDDALTMASIIEKECSGYPDEMAAVSSVFWNRINNPSAQGTPNLGSDPTVKYADLLEEQGYAQDIWKGYSTYSCQGLPTGPICAPGEDALEAAVSPAESNNYYFFTDKNQKFYYFETYSEFQSTWENLK